MLRAAIGMRVIRTNGATGQVIAVEEDGRFTVRMDSGPTWYRMPPSTTEFRTETVEDRFQVNGPIRPSLRSQLEALERGETKEAPTVIAEFETLSEFRAVHAVCTSLWKQGLPVDFFLLIKDSKALRRTRDLKGAITQAEKAEKYAASSKERGIAFTLLAAALAVLLGALPKPWMPAFEPGNTMVMPITGSASWPRCLPRVAASMMRKERSMRQTVEKSKG